jgi:signal transduction histidine kinase
MAILSTQSLRRVLLVYELAFIGLVVVTGAMGGLWAYFWQQTSAESLRLNELAHTMQEIRTTLYQQIQDVALARLREDPAAGEIHGRYYRRIQEGFNALRRQSTSRQEDYAVQAIQEAYGQLQSDLHASLNDPYFLNRIVRFRTLETRHAPSLLGGFDRACEAFGQLVDLQLNAQSARIALWTRYAPYLLPVPVLLSLGLLYFSRRSLTRNFVRPMDAIIQGTGRMSAGELGHRLPLEGVREVALLADSVNQLATDLAVSRDALVESERQAALGALVPVVAHNIRNPLAAIRASAQLLDHVDENAERREISAEIVATVDRLGRWVSALVSYLHPLKPRFRPIAADTLVEAVLELIETRCRERRIQLERTPWADGAQIEVDSDLMEQALYGLLGNAIEASQPGTSVRIGLLALADSVILEIEDTAGGIPFIPEPAGLEPGPSTKRFGTGLGIPVAFKVCKAHGWTLEFAVTEAPGTRITITVPRLQDTHEHFA